MWQELKEARAAWKLILANFEEFKRVQDAFRLVDKDFSGLITRDELRRLMPPPSDLDYRRCSCTSFELDNTRLVVYCSKKWRAEQFGGVTD